MFPRKQNRGIMGYILKHVNLITMEEDGVIPDVDLFIANGKIMRISRRIDIAGIDTYDCSGKFAMPGLIDAHVHMDSSEITAMLLANGVTACRNMWGFQETQQWRKEIAEGKRFGSHVYSMGPLTDGVTYWEHSLIVQTEEEAVKAVIDCINGGYEYVKTYPSIPRDAFIALMNTAKTLGIKVMGHGNYHVTFQELKNLGYYSLEHISCLPKNEEEVVMLAESGMWFCPTLIVARTIEDYVHCDKDVRTTKNYDNMCEYWRKDWDKITAWRKALHRYDDYELQAEIEMAKVFVKNSDNVLMGTDVPNPGVTGGFSAHQELEDLVATFGMTPFEAIRTATVNPARSLGIVEQKGRLKEGMDADILILEKNPLEDIRNTETFTAVIKEGNYYEKAFLNEVLAKVKGYIESEIHPLM